jgi:hypothetical protein
MAPVIGLDEITLDEIRLGELTMIRWNAYGDPDADPAVVVGVDPLGSATAAVEWAAAEAFHRQSPLRLLGIMRADSRQPTADSRQPTAGSRIRSTTGGRRACGVPWATG